MFPFTCMQCPSEMDLCIVRTFEIAYLTADFCLWMEIEVFQLSQCATCGSWKYTKFKHTAE